MDEHSGLVQATFHVELAGSIREGRERGDVAAALARLFRLELHRAGRLLQDRPVIIKRGLSEAQAQKYLAAIRKAGAACDMVPEQPARLQETAPAFVCPKCGYTAVHEHDSLISAGDCPKCGIVVAKYLKARGLEQAQAVPPADPSRPEENTDAPTFTQDDSISFPAWAPLANLFGFCPLDNPLRLKAAPASLATAGFYHRLWAGAATLCHCFFMGIIMQVPVGIVAGIYMATNDMPLTRSTADSLRGFSFLLGFCHVTIVLPVLWNGHSFGMRALRIALVDRRYEHEVGLSTQMSFLRALAVIAKWCTVLPLAAPLFNKGTYSFEDLLMNTRQAAVDRLPPRPWNIALRSFAAAILLHFAIALPGSCILSTLSGSSSPSSTRTMDASGQAHFRTLAKTDTGSGIAPAARNTLMQLRAAVMQHAAETGSLPDTPEQFEQMLTRIFPPGAQVLELYNNDALDFQSVDNSFEVGLRQGERWTVINLQGRFSKRDEF